MTPEQVATELQLSRATVYRLLSAGSIPSYRPGGRSLRIRRDELAEALEKRRL